MTCTHPSLQINEQGICCDCGGVSTERVINSAAQIESEARAFVLGWRHARDGMALSTAGQVVRALPTWTAGEVDCYLNGAADGAAGDRWRYDQIPAWFKDSFR